MHDVERELRDLGERTGRDVTYGSVPARRIVRRARLRRAAIVAVPTAAVVAMAALVYPTLADLRRGGGGAAAVDLAAVARATEAAETARVELETTTETDGEPVTTRGVGEIDFEGRRSHLRMEGIGPDGSERGEMISVGDTAYQRTDGSKWFEFELDRGAFGAGAGPADMLPYLETVSDEVTNLGDEELDGVNVTHYRARIDPGIVDSFGPAAATTEFEFDPMDVWVDDLGRLRKLTFGATVRDERGGEATVAMTMRLWDFGVPVDIVAPDPDDVTDEPEASDGEGFSRSTGESEFGEATFVYSAAGPDGPGLLLHYAGSELTGICVDGLSADAEGAEIVHEESGRTVAVFESPRDVGDTGERADCTRGITDEDGDALTNSPTDYSLRIERETGEDRVVQLVLSFGDG